VAPVPERRRCSARWRREERDQGFADAVRVHDRLREWYVRCGYEPVTVPCATVEERCEFVLDALDGHAGRADDRDRLMPALAVRGNIAASD
jgi:hypothetical protein